MMPLTFAKAGETKKIIRVTGRDDTRRFLAGLGFVEGVEVIVVSENMGNLIVNVKETRVAVDKTMAARIIV